MSEPVYVFEPRFLQKEMNRVYPRTTECIEFSPSRLWLISPSGTSRALLWTEGVCSVQTSPPLIVIFFHMNILHDSSQSFEIHFNIVLPSVFKSNESSLLIRFFEYILHVFQISAVRITWQSRPSCMIDHPRMSDCPLRTGSSKSNLYLWR